MISVDNSRLELEIDPKRDKVWLWIWLRDNNDDRYPIRYIDDEPINFRLLSLTDEQSARALKLLARWPGYVKVI